MNIDVLRLTRPEFIALMPHLVDVHLLAMGYSQELRKNREKMWTMHSILPGFRCLLAHSGPQILGFSFGSYGTTSTWWHQQVAAGLRLRNGNSPASTALLNNYFEVSEVHVSPVFQKRGIGRRLVVELLADVTAPVALLSTPEVPTESNGAFKLYRSLGFYDVLRQHLFAGDPRPFAILGANLPLQGA